MENWIYLDTIEEMGMRVDEYINEKGNLIKQAWSDGFEEIFEIQM